MSLLSTSVTNMSTALTGWFGSANALLVDFKNHIDNHPSNIAPVLINVPEDYSSIEAALNSLAGKQQNSTTTEIKVNANYAVAATEKMYSYGLTNIVITTDAASPKTITVNAATGLIFKDGGIILENLHITSSSATNLLYFARIGNKVILSNLTLTCTAGRVLTSDMSKVEVNDCDITSNGMQLYDSDFVIRRCNMTGNNAATNKAIWLDTSTYARVENTAFTDFSIGKQVTNNSTLRRSSPSYSNVGTNVVTDSTSSAS